MNSNQLAVEVHKIIIRCMSRITGIGHVQYSVEQEVQDFELRSFEELQQGILEEIEDTINHLTMLHIRVRRIGEKANRLAQGI